jgi:DNA polymerase/3'-5' exonuclease PolX
MMQYPQAKHIADRIVELFIPHCHVVHIAGSIRREKKEVKDIEIVCLPKKEFVATDLFLGGSNKVVAGFAEALKTIQQEVIKGNQEGRYMQMIIKGGATLDLFMPQKEDYYRQLAIRTGSAEYSAFVIANGWKRKGWCGTHDGLRLQDECVQGKSGNWMIADPFSDPTLPPVWQAEQEFFEWLGVEYVHPSKRELPKSINAYQ